MLEYQIDFPEKIKVAVLVGMVCKEMQDEVFRDTADLMKDGAYSKVREIMKHIAGNRISQDTPQPMDIGAVNEDYGEDHLEEPTPQQSEEWVEDTTVQAVSWDILVEARATSPGNARVKEKGKETKRVTLKGKVQARDTPGT